MTVDNHGTGSGEHRSGAAAAGAATRRPLPLGALALTAAVVFAVMHGVAVATAADGGYAAATALAWAVIVGTVASLLLGAAAVVQRRGRRWGAIAIAVSLLANPLVLVWLLGAVGG